MANVLCLGEYSFYIVIIFFCWWFSWVQLPHANPGFNNSPFKFTKYSNAYMLVYIRASDKDKIICSVNEKDIAEHLKVRCLTHWCCMIYCYISDVKILQSTLHFRQDWRKNKKKKSWRRRRRQRLTYIPS